MRRYHAHTVILLFYEHLGLDVSHKLLEVGLGSGYGTALAREVVRREGLVVLVEIDPLTFEFAKGNLDVAGFHDIILVRKDGGPWLSRKISVRQNMRDSRM